MRLKIIEFYDGEILDAEITPSNPDEISTDDHDFMSLGFDFVDELQRSGVTLLYSSYRRDLKDHKFNFAVHCTPKDREMILRRLKEISMRG
jgi:hypothetical protein